MSELSDQKEQLCQVAKSIYDRGLTHGSSGNLSMRLSDGTFLVTPTGSSCGYLRPDLISHLDQNWQEISGLSPTKELPLHQAFYQTRPGTGAVVHLHSHYSVALSMLKDIDPEDVLPTITPYAIMQLGKVKLLPFFVPGDPAMGDAIVNLEGRHSAILLAHHGPVVAGKNLMSTLYAMEEFEATAKLALMMRNIEHTYLDKKMVEQIKAKYNKK